MNATIEFTKGVDIFKTLGVRASKLRVPLWERVVPIIWETRAEQFDKESAYVGGALVPWAKPVPSFRRTGVVSRVRGRFAQRQVLNQTGRLRRAMTSHSAPATVEVGDDYIVMRSHVDYEQYHQKGATIPVTPKSRVFLGKTYGVWLKKDTKTLRLPARPINFDDVNTPKQFKRAMDELVAYIVEPVDKQAAESIRRGT